MKRASGGVASMKNEGIIRELSSDPDPSVRYKARTLLLGEPVTSSEMISLRRSIARSERAKRLLAARAADGTMPAHTYQKWQGPHWTLYSLAQIDYPPGDGSLAPMRNQVYDWLLEPAHLEFRRSLLIPGQEDRFRRCASQEGNAIWYSIRLGIDDDRTRELVRRLVAWQWPDGGWNCDKRPEARTSSVIESLIPLRSLALAGASYHDDAAARAAERTAEWFLSRRLFRTLHDGQPILKEFSSIQYPIQFYDVLFVLLVMAEAGRIRDPRCLEALELLRSKRLSGGGFPLEKPNAATSASIRTRGTYADWGPSGRRNMNPLVTVAALWALKEAGDQR
jgi:hypothetical protein